MKRGNDPCLRYSLILVETLRIELTHFIQNDNRAKGLSFVLTPTPKQLQNWINSIEGAFITERAMIQKPNLCNTTKRTEKRSLLVHREFDILERIETILKCSRTLCRLPERRRAESQHIRGVCSRTTRSARRHSVLRGCYD